MMRGKITELVSLLVDDVGCMLNLIVNHFTVLNIDEWSKEHDSVSHKYQTPCWDDFDQAVGDERSKEDLLNMISVL